MEDRPQTRPTFYVLLAFILLFLLFVAYAYTQQDNVREAVVRGQWQSSSSGVIFVSVSGHDPSDSFIRRFNTSKVLVRKKSQGVEKKNRFGDVWGTYYIDKSTGLKGSLLNIGSILWLGPYRAQVEVGHPGSGERFTLQLTSRGWMITYREQTVIV